MPRKGKRAVAGGTVGFQMAPKTNSNQGLDCPRPIVIVAVCLLLKLTKENRKAGMLKEKNRAFDELRRKNHRSANLGFELHFSYTLRNSLIINGAGEGNRTLVSGLGSPHSTIEPHPHSAEILCSKFFRGAQQVCFGIYKAEENIWIRKCHFVGVAALGVHPLGCPPPPSALKRGHQTGAGLQNENCGICFRLA